jgi:hypothetical protein
MVRRRLHSRGGRLAALTSAALCLAVVAGGTSYAAAPLGSPPSPGERGSRAAARQVNLSTHPVKVVSSTGHRLRVLVLASQSSSATQIQVGVETRNQAEQHEWSFKVPRSAVSLSAKGEGRIRLTAKRSGGFATISLRLRPEGPKTTTSCHGRTATRIRHVTLSGALRFKTRSTGKHAWGSVGSAHRTIHFSKKSKVTWITNAASSCPTPQFPCRGTRLWQATDGSTDELDFFSSVNQGAHAEIGGVRFVSLDQPAGATRADIVSLPQPSPNQLVVNPDGSATMQATFHGGTVTMASSQPAITQTERCGKGKQKISVDSWSGDLTNGVEPIVLHAQVFGDFSTADTLTAAFGRIRVLH